MSRLKLNLLCIGIIVLFQWTPIGVLLRSSSFLHLIWGAVALLWIAVLTAAFPGIRKRWKRRL